MSNECEDMFIQNNIKIHIVVLFLESKIFILIFLF